MVRYPLLSPFQAKKLPTAPRMEVVGHVESYAGEPLAHSSDEEEDTEEDQDGLSPRDFRSFQ